MIDEVTYQSFRSFIENIEAKHKNEKIIGYETKGRNEHGERIVIVTFAKK